MQRRPRTRDRIEDSRPSSHGRRLIALVIFCGLAGNAAADRACDQRDPLRQAFFGDLHVHTAYSQDAFTFGTRATPDDAYRFAKGEPLQIGARRAQLARPLDFAAVTDHAEFLGAAARCTRTDSPVYGTESCQTYRGEDLEEPSNFAELVQLVVRKSAAVESDEVCGEDGRLCRDAAAEPWRDIQRFAELHYDRSPACNFTTFVAYEYSLSPALSKVHRNVIFRGDTVIPLPIHARAEPEPIAMLRRLRDECIDGLPGCDVLAIPHNPNMSDGRMFRTEYPGAISPIQEQRAARLRAAMEPVVEMMQVKGDSECRIGLAGVAGPVDELCGFEKMRRAPPDCGGEIGSGALLGKGCVDRNDFVRHALVAGLAEEERIGVNPFQFGFAASTDEHEGTMGHVEEDAFADPRSRGSQRPTTNPGGLFGLWSEQNSREALFDSIRRREVFGTSGTRIQPRFFAGFELDASLCKDPDMLKKAYESGVPMGAVLPGSAPKGDAPDFLVTALRDAGTTARPGGKLERLQIVKGWVGEGGVYEHRVFDVAGEAASVDDEIDTATCQPSGRGHDTLCAVWSDPEFDPAERAVYYARIVEMPSCRWSTRLCNTATGKARPAWCDQPGIPKTIRERAWTSPIWYSPES